MAVGQLKTSSIRFYWMGTKKLLKSMGIRKALLLKKIMMTYISISQWIPYLDWVSSYYYKDTDQEDQSLVPHNNAIYLDEPLTEVFVETKKSGKKLAQTLASEALENYSVSIRKNLEESGEDPTRMDSILDLIDEDIKNMRYVSEVSKYYIYEMEVYRVFVDRINGDVYFNYTMGLATYSVLVDVNDPHIFTPLYMAG